MKKWIEELKLTGRLPSPAGVGVKILQVTQNDEFSTDDLSRTIQSDPALAGRIIRMANSALVGGCKPITTVNDAVVRLGASSVRNLALGFSLISAYRDGQCTAFDFPRFWTDSLARAISAQELARATRLVAPAEAYICALLSGIGRLALACVHPELYTEVLHRVKQEGDEVELAREERVSLDTDHRELGRAILEDWKLPDSHGKAIECYSLPSAAEQGDATARTLASILTVAAAIAAVCCERRDVQQLRRMQELLAAKAALRIETPRLLEVCDAIATQWTEWGGLLRVPTQSIAPFATLAHRAEELAPDAVAEDPAAELVPPVPAPYQKIDRITVLVADDDPTVRKVVSAGLMRHGCRVIEAPDGTEALRMALEVNPHLVIADWQMPGLDGLELTRQLRRTQIGRDMYVVMLTGRDRDEKVVEAFDAGIDDFISKPINFKIMMARVAAGERTVRLRDDLAHERRQIERQLAELAILNRRLETISVTDMLTGLPNRRFAFGTLNDLWRRTSGDLSVIVIDVDHFKNVNDQFGHDVGDLVLKEVGGRLRGSVRTDDSVCRIGGEEFLVICAGCNDDHAVLVAERIRSAVEQLVTHNGPTEHRVTISLGVAQQSDDMKNPHDLLRAADQALYDAKAHGRNRVCRSLGVAIPVLRTV